MTEPIFSRHGKVYCEVDGTRTWFATFTDLTAEHPEEHHPDAVKGELCVEQVSPQFARLLRSMVNGTDDGPTAFSIEYTLEDSEGVQGGDGGQAHTLTDVQFWSLPLGEPTNRCIEFSGTRA